MRPGLEDYLAGMNPVARPLIVALDKAVRKAHPGFDVTIKYGILMYALDGDWRTWVTAISPAKKGVGLRFLYGVLLEDPRHVLRAGSSVLKTWDFALGDAVNQAAVGAYVKEAVAKYGTYKANSAKVLAASREAARGRTSKRSSP